MGRQFHPVEGPWSKFAPARWQAAFSIPTPTLKTMRGRTELVIGRLGAGKTTWGSLRAVRLARVTGRALATNGEGWPDPWQCIDSFEAMDALRDTVIVLDEVHLLMPSSKGLMGREHELFLVRWLSLSRKRGNCVIATTQAWTRVATHFRQLVTTVWIAEAMHAGKLHRARPFDHADEGGKQAFPSQWYGPAAAKIPTHAGVWTGLDAFGNLQRAARIGPEDAASSSGAGASPPVARSHHRPITPPRTYPAVSPPGFEFWKSTT